MRQEDFEKQLLSELDSLYRTARYLTGDDSLAEDVVHDVIVKALKARHTLQAGMPMRPWLFGDQLYRGEWKTTISGRFAQLAWSVLPSSVSHPMPTDVAQ